MIDFEGSREVGVLGRSNREGRLRPRVAEIETDFDANVGRVGALFRERRAPLFLELPKTRADSFR